MLASSSSLDDLTISRMEVFWPSGQISAMSSSSMPTMSAISFEVSLLSIRHVSVSETRILRYCKLSALICEEAA